MAAEDPAGATGWRVVVPVKGGEHAKTRLDLPPGTRRDVALAMALDCVAAVLATDGVDRVVCVSDDPLVAAAVVALGAEVVPAGRPGLGAAVAAGLARVGPGPSAVLVADLPALVPADLAAALAAAAADPGPVVVPDADGTGSVLVADRDGPPPHRFGPGSAAAHVAAGARGLPGPWPSLRHDVDTLGALHRVLPLGPGPRTRAALTTAATTTTTERSTPVPDPAPLPAPRRRHTAPAVPEPAPGALRAALARAAEGDLDAATAEVLLHARGRDLAVLCALTAPVRDAAMAAAGRPGVVTYSRKVFVPVTRLCRDRCHYCTFATVPGRLPVLYLSPEDVLATARAGAAAGCKEALFTLGDAPEDRWPQAAAWLAERGFASTLDYVQHLARLVLDETGLLPHLNPGVMTAEALASSRPLAPSMGMMLETTARRLWSEPGGVHHGSPDKDPDLRLRVLHDAGRTRVPFTTGILVGIGETPAERVDSVLAIRDVARAHDGVQEVIVQNFRAKDDTAMCGEADLGHEEYLATIAVARLLLGPGLSLQAPPNLSDPAQRAELLAAGVDDWGGVSPLTPDHVNPERPWPQLDDLAATTRAAGFRLAERLTAHPRFVLDALTGSDRWIDPALHGAVAALADPVTGLARESTRPVGRAAAQQVRS